MTSMKILYHHRTTASDGSAVHINGLVDALRELGATVRVVAPKIAAKEVGDAGQASWVSRLRAGLPRFMHELGELAFNVPEAAALRRAVGEFEPDVIYQRSNLYLLSGARVARQHGLPLIEEVNAPYFHERSRHGGIALPQLANWAERRAWQRADEVITVTGVLADMVASQGVARDRLHVMHNGIDRSLLSSSALDPQAKVRLNLAQYTVLGFTGFVRDWNGLDTVLDQLARPEGRNWYLLIVGDGPARPGLEQRAHGLGVASRLRFTGIVKRSEVAGYVSAFDIALQPAANPYASPLKLFEYMALGRAIVAPDQPNIREVLTHETDALLFTPDDPAALAIAIRRLAEDPELRNRMATSAPLTVRQRQLTWRSNAQRVLGIAERLISSSHAQGKWVEQSARTRT
jgi:glycosyltransferase involved in cell wall biosynthesis